MLQSKDIKWPNGFKKKSKTHIQPAYNEHNSDLKIHKEWKWGNVTTYSMQMEKKKKVRVAILISDKTNLKKKDCNERQRRNLCND